MKANDRFNNQPPASGWENHATGCVASKDGTTIGYHQLGHGPALVLVHGAMESAQSHQELAQALASDFSVYVPDRRGRGHSGPHGEDYGLAKEVEDLDALLTETGARNIFGVSSGGLISLQAAASLPTIDRIALFEPPLSINGSAPTAWLRRYDQEMAKGKLASALVTGMKGAQMGPPIFNFVPRPLLQLLTRVAMAGEDRNARAGTVPMRALAPTLHYDGRVVLEMGGTLEGFSALRAEVLLLGGSRSPAYLKVALDALESVLPHVQRVELAGLNHGASGNRNRGGQPERVAQELRRFFSRPKRVARVCAPH
ncbi:MAG: alpha/beta hydrolase [Candidatus Dormibacteraeota bacterium]|uniref:Alpha/beta hydrolase n=1 Tax=Candidatus Dormiibacter inghamiae TaxID=3127013 RepID=A0A934KIR5_9BACT|nr:alpha/beta hydrolase [Candidatus Dormibacteraeota bacterium]MBJ7606350.1 alpha/beta hydrolase [Candidatus Dormibacteraeota bacterium]